MEKILGYINGIKRSGLSTVEVGYGNWMIVFTDKAIYFVKLNSHYSFPIGGILGGAVGGYLQQKVSEALSNKKDAGIMNEEISNILSTAQSHFEFKIEDMKKLELDSVFLSSNKAINFLGKENNKIKIILTKDQYQKFVENCNNFYSYDTKVLEK